LIFQQPKGCFLKKNRPKFGSFTLFYPIKNVFKNKKGYSYLKRKRVTLPASAADPEKVEKVDV
jgi:hypothetical protein